MAPSLRNFLQFRSLSPVSRLSLINAVIAEVESSGKADQDVRFCVPGLGPLNRRVTISPANLEHAAMVWKTLGKYLLLGFSLSILCVPVGGERGLPPEHNG